MADILVIDDYPVHRDLLARWLARWGHWVVTADSGALGLAYARTAQFDLVLLDMEMPGLNGCEVARRLKANPRTAALRVLALTAHLSGDIEAQCIAVGCDDFESKPIDFPRLQAKIQTLCLGAPATRRREACVTVCT
jgi:CheY-like chemotaxis protein